MIPEAEHINCDLLRKYDRPGPRYTSYPTVPEWSTDFGSGDYEKALKRISGSDDPLALYFHIPFCAARCFYCGCTTEIIKDNSAVDSYIDQLQQEMALVTSLLGKRRRVIQLHWGGGTPTALSCGQMEKLYQHIADHFDLDMKGELSVEIDPRVTTFEQLRRLRRLGFNRISLGIQDLASRVQEAIGRCQTAEQSKKVFAQCREEGFASINVDLVYGLPHQTVESFSKTVKEIAAMRPDRVAVYSFAYLPDLKSHQRRIPVETVPSTACKYDLFASAVEGFLENGYIQIGMDHFALPDDELAQALKAERLHRNFMGYTTRPTSNSLGFGMSAISELQEAFAQNLSRLELYGQALASGKPATFRGCHLTADDLIRRQAILSLMCNFRLAFKDVDDRFQIDSRSYFKNELAELESFISDDLIEISHDVITVRPAGRIFVRNIAMGFDAYLRRGKAKDKLAFSRTI